MNALREIVIAINDMIYNNPVVNIALIIVLAYSSVHIFIMLYRLHKLDKEEEKRLEEMRTNAQIISFPSHDNIKS